MKGAKTFIFLLALQSKLSLLFTLIHHGDVVFVKPGNPIVSILLARFTALIFLLIVAPGARRCLNLLWQ